MFFNSGKPFVCAAGFVLHKNAYHRCYAERNEISDEEAEAQRATTSDKSDARATASTVIQASRGPYHQTGHRKGLWPQIRATHQIKLIHRTRNCGSPHRRASPPLVIMLRQEYASRSCPECTAYAWLCAVCVVRSPSFFVRARRLKYLAVFQV